MKRILGVIMLSFALLLSGAGFVEAATLRGNPNTKVYHLETCKYAASKGATAVFASEADAKGKGFSSCSVCFPDSAKKAAPSSGNPYVGNAKTKIFHKAGCKVAPKKNPVVLNNLLEAHKQGFKPCKTCNPAGKAASVMQK